MSKYSALGQFLRGQPTEEVPISFSEIEGVIGKKLPRSAYAHRPWWSNNPSNSAMTKVWLEAGFRTERVDMPGKKLVFRRMLGTNFNQTPSATQSAPVQTLSESTSVKKQSRRHPLFGRLKGTFTIDPSWDLTQPAMPEWADMIDAKYGPGPKK
jgi:hypothetical protein